MGIYKENKLKNSILVILILIQFTGYNAISQPSTLIFKHLSVEDGLSQSTVHAIIQDKNGFMWFGTDIGLNKYDGNKFVVYQNNAIDSTSIASNFIVELFEDSYGFFWVGNGYNGLDRFDRENEVFIHYKHNQNNESSISNNNIRTIFEDRNKNLWIGTSGGGLNLFNRKTNSFTHIQKDPSNPNSLGSNYISSISEDLDGNLWIGSTEGILIKYDPLKKTFTNFELYGQFKADLFNTTFCSTYIDSDNCVWFGTENGLFTIDQKTNKITHYEKNDPEKTINVNAISSILEYEKDIFFIATDHGGLNVFNKKTGKFSYFLNKRYNETTISNNQLYKIYKSPDGIIWIGSFHGGINILDKSAIKFEQYKFLITGPEAINCCNSVLTMAQDKDNNIWIGNDGQGIEIFDPIKRTVKQLLPEPGNLNSIRSNCITEIYKDNSDNLWIGAYLEGLSVLNWKTKKFTHFKHDSENPNSICGNNVWTITQDTDGNFWIGTMGNGLDVYSPKTNVFKHFINSPSNSSSLSNNDVFKILEARNGDIWIGTRNGLNLIKKGQSQFIRFLSDKSNKKGIFGAWVYDIFQDSKGNIWIGTEQALNLYHPETSEFTQYTEKDGLLGNAILCILEDKNNNLWFSTNKGLTKLNLKDHVFKNYDIADGLQGNEFNYTSSLIDIDGKMYFGGKNGFNVFHPDSIVNNQKIPPIYLTDFSIHNTSITPRSDIKVIDKYVNFVKDISLTYKQNVISFEFAALNFTNPKKNQYAYKLVGFDKAWNYVGNRNNITYTNLNPGSYIFKVKGSNNDGIWNEEGIAIQITINPPFWKTNWFIIIQLLLIMALVYLFILYREKKLRDDKKNLQIKVQERTLQIEMQKEELEKHRNHLEQLIEHRTDELRSAKEKAEESDRLKSAFLANMSHEIRTPMNAIVGFSNQLEDPDITMEEKHEYISLINSNSESLLVLIEDILDFSLIEANQVITRNEVFNMNELLENLHASFVVSNKKKNLTFLLSIDPNLNNIRLNTDKYRIKQILANLMNNAYKFTHKGYIELGYYFKDNFIIFYVKDSGIGISKEDLPVIFDRFRKLEKGHTITFRGTGLGLAISKRLAEIMGGHINVESKLGEGSIFSLSFPFDIIKTEELVKIAPIKKKEFDWKSKNILIVEDEKANYLYLQKVLGKTHVNIEWAENGEEAVNLFQTKCNFDVVLMDIKMPKMNGYEAARIIKLRKPDQVIIAQTAYARPEDEIEMRKAGFTDYLSKPIKADFLYRTIEKYF